MRKRYVDISVPLFKGMVHWPGDPPVKISRIKSMKRGDNCDVSLLSFGSHTGTHMDAPSHFIQGKESIDQIPLDATVGPARVIEISSKVSIEPEEIQRHKIRPGERILFKTLNSSRCWKGDKFVKDFVYIPSQTARELAKLRVRSVGVDYLSVGGYKKDGIETHKILLSNGIWIIEGLNLSQVKPGKYELICLPLKIFKGDGSPVRAILRTL